MNSDWKEKDWAEITYEEFRFDDHRPLMTHVQRAVRRVWPNSLFLVSESLRPLWRPINLLLLMSSCREFYIGSDPQTMQSFLGNEQSPSIPKLRADVLDDFRWYIHIHRHKMNKLRFTVTFPTDGPDHRLLVVAFDSEFYRYGEPEWVPLIT